MSIIKLGLIAVKMQMSVISLSICLLVAGCSNLEPYESISEVNGGSAQMSTTAPSVSSQQSESQDSVSNCDDFANDISWPEINADAFLENTDELLFIRYGYDGFYLIPEKSKEFLFGINFSQLKPIDEKEVHDLAYENAKKHILTDEAGYATYVEQMLEFGQTMELYNSDFTTELKLYLSIGIAKYSVGEWVPFDKPPAQLVVTHYFYSMSQEFYDTVFDRVGKYTQSGHSLGGADFQPIP